MPEWTQKPKNTEGSYFAAQIECAEIIVGLFLYQNVKYL
jgi:hypothetical protein